MVESDHTEGHLSILFKIIGDKVTIHCFETYSKITLRPFRLEFDFSNDFDVNEKVINADGEIKDMMEFTFLNKVNDYDVKNEYKRRIQELGNIGKQYSFNTHISLSKYIEQEQKRIKEKTNPDINIEKNNKKSEKYIKQEQKKNKLIQI